MSTPTTIQHYPQSLLDRFGITTPEAVTTKQAAEYLTKEKGIPTAASSLEVYRCLGRGCRYKKIGSRVFYTLPWLDEYAAGIEVKIYDPSKVRQEAA